MKRLAEAIDSMNKVLLRAKTPAGVYEGVDELNDANRAVLVAMKQKYGSVYMVKINGKEGIQEYVSPEAARNFCCDYCMPIYDEKVAQLIRSWNEDLSVAVLLELYSRLKALDAVMLIWS